MLRCVPVVVAPDQSYVIRIAAEGDEDAFGDDVADDDVRGESTNQSRARIRSYPVGCVSRSALEAPPPAGPGWTRERARSACEQLVKCGVARVDDDPRSAGAALLAAVRLREGGTATKEVTRARVSGR